MKITVKGYVYQWNASAAFAETGECVYDLSDFPSRSYEKHLTHLFQELNLPHEIGSNDLMKGDYMLWFDGDYLVFGESDESLEQVLVEEGADDDTLFYLKTKCAFIASSLVKQFTQAQEAELVIAQLTGLLEKESSFAEEFIEQQGIAVLVERVFQATLAEPLMLSALDALTTVLDYVTGMVSVLSSPKLNSMIISFIDAPSAVAERALSIIEKITRAEAIGFPLVKAAFNYAKENFVEPLNMNNLVHFLSEPQLDRPLTVTLTLRILSNIARSCDAASRPELQEMFAGTGLSSALQGLPPTPEYLTLVQLLQSQLADVLQQLQSSSSPLPEARMRGSRGLQPPSFDVAAPFLQPEDLPLADRIQPKLSSLEAEKEELKGQLNASKSAAEALRLEIVELKSASGERDDRITTLAAELAVSGKLLALAKAQEKELREEHQRELQSLAAETAASLARSSQPGAGPEATTLDQTLALVREEASLYLILRTKHSAMPC
jgi:hypothetical protein